jgi:hypothetical protein
MAGAVDGSPGLHGLATWAMTTVIVIAAASMLASTGSAIGAMAGPSFTGSARDAQLSASEIEAAADMAGTMALASFVALIIGAMASYLGARAAADREVRLHPHTTTQQRM